MSQQPHQLDPSSANGSELSDLLGTMTLHSTNSQPTPDGGSDSLADYVANYMAGFRARYQKLSISNDHIGNFGKQTPNIEYSTTLPCTEAISLRFSPQPRNTCVLLDFVSAVDGTRIETPPGLTIHETTDNCNYRKKFFYTGGNTGVQLYYVNPLLGYEVRSVVDDEHVMYFSFRNRVPIGEPRGAHPFYPFFN